MRFSKRRRMAGSSSHGTLVAPSTSKPSIVLLTPCICTRNSVLMRREDSDSPSERLPHMESISSINMIACSSARESSNSVLTSFSDSPCHLDTRSDDEIAKNLASASVATAFARYDLPVPGGPYRRIPFHGLRLPTNNCGNFRGRITASLSASFAPSRPATSSHDILGFSVTMAELSESASFCFSASSFESPPFASFDKLAAPPPPPPPPPLPLLWARSSSTALRSSARFMYPSTRLRMVSLTAGFFSCLRPVMKYSKHFL
mmetsp:Transcript_12141/g.21592  ORF Transcript_12141/g.21592 Transcript_12141/m.21592 type:complete len:261 (-) Transcript_12141:158-940(-)